MCTFLQPVLLAVAALTLEMQTKQHERWRQCNFKDEESCDFESFFFSSSSSSFFLFLFLIVCRKPWVDRECLPNFHLSTFATSTATSATPSLRCSMQRFLWIPSLRVLVLQVSVPGNSLFSIVAVRCGHCCNLLSVNMGDLLQKLPLQDLQTCNTAAHDGRTMACGSPSKFNRPSLFYTVPKDQEQIMLPIRPPEKRHRVPSAYNRFIKEEIQRIKANNPDISHREAFSTAAKNWAHFPHIDFGLTIDGSKQAKIDEQVAATVAAPGGQKAQSFF
ncbi:YABBY protein [Musa troglodytarum]|uniref:YABBY protein n=1 Tax=Musa troglodytarum TaxID=320322 RepID=A0A9E7GFW7_9LILI|nr:YABBY protein [Musa troglodytarum]